MQAELWKALLRRIPAEQTDNLMVKTAEGTEINVQALLLMDEQVMVLRGRIAGSNDAGRVFVVPYEHLDHMGFQKPLSDAELQSVFGITPAAPPVAFEPLPESPPPEPAVAVPAPAPPPIAANPGLLAKVPTRSKIIQRLRLRTEVRDGAPPRE